MAQRDYEEQPEAPDLGAAVQLETGATLVGPPGDRDGLDAGYVPPDRPYVLEDDDLVFEIESWARSGDRVSNLLYTKLLLAKEIQLNLWTETCLGVARNSGGRLRGGVRVHTRRVQDEDIEPGPDL